MTTKGTNYVVLRIIDEPGLAKFEHVALIKGATGALDAVRTAAEENGRYLAIPSRSFTPYTVTVETKREVRVLGGTTVAKPAEASAG